MFVYVIILHCIDRVNDFMMESSFVIHPKIDKVTSTGKLTPYFFVTTMNFLAKSALTLAMASGAVALNNAGDRKDVIAPVESPNFIQRTVDDARGFQDTMPVLTNVSEAMARKVDNLMKHTMNQCLSRHEKVDQRAYRAEKATWPEDIQQRVYACCGVLNYGEGPYFEIEMDGKKLQTNDGRKYFETELTCPKPIRKIAPSSKKKEESMLDVDIHHVG